MSDHIRVDESGDVSVIRVASATPAGPLASAVSHAILDGKEVTLRAVGAGAVNQAVKGVAIAQSFVGSHAKTLYVRPGFATVAMPDGAQVSAIVMRITAN